MFVQKSGPTAYFDVDSTLIEWDLPTEKTPKDELVQVPIRGIAGVFRYNKHNLKHLHQLALRGHNIVIWSAAGVEWCEAVAKALKIDSVVGACLNKPSYYIDDIGDANKFMGKHVFYDIDGNRHGFVPESVNGVK